VGVSTSFIQSATSGRLEFHLQIIQNGRYDSHGMKVPSRNAASANRGLSASKEYQNVRDFSWIDAHRQAALNLLLPRVARLDGRLPPFASRKFALEALEHVRHNDSSGPLADDAAIKIADYYMKRHEFDTAALYYSQFVVEYPKSPLCAYARRAAFNARIRSYLKL
jgi:hypothetical protein